MAALVAITTLLALSGCVQIPTSGPVQPGVQIGVVEEPPRFQFTPAGPQTGDRELAIVSGFFGAMLAYPADPAVVQEFLTEKAAASWQPGSGTTVYADTLTYTIDARGQVRTEGERVGRLDERGVWMSSEGTPPLVRPVELVREKGEWRISNPPDGLYLSESYFERYYDSYALYFLDPTEQILVPDPVYLPVGEQTATLLMEGLVRGPTDWLGGAVESFVPSTAAPPLPVVVSGSGVAEVPLGGDPDPLPVDEQELLMAQIAWTLRQVPEISALDVTVGGSSLQVEEGVEDAAAAAGVVDVGFGEGYDPADSAASSKLFATRRDRLFDVAGDAVLPVPGPFGDGRVPVQAFAVDRTGQKAAVVTGDGRVRVGSLADGADGADDPGVWLRGGRQLLRPEWDFSGLLWIVDRSPGRPLAYVLRGGRQRRIELAGDVPTDVRAFSLARNGTRVAVIEGTGQRARLLVGRVVRPTDGSLDMRIDRWRVVRTPGLELQDFRDVAWSTPTELAVVARERDEVPQLFTVGIDGSYALASTLLQREAVSVAASSTESLPTVVCTADGRLWVQGVDRWELLVERRLRQPSYVE